MRKQLNSRSIIRTWTSGPSKFEKYWYTTPTSESGSTMEETSSPVLLEHLFRREAGRIVSWLVGLLGSHHLQLAEDAVQESILRAAHAWRFHRIPEKPEAWLFRVAHNYAISALRRETNFGDKT